MAVLVKVLWDETENFPENAASVFIIQFYSGFHVCHPTLDFSLKRLADHNRQSPGYNNIITLSFFNATHSLKGQFINVMTSGAASVSIKLMRSKRGVIGQD